MWLRKDQGGCQITYRGAVYAWEQDGDVTDVPHELAVDLVQLGGYQVVPPPEPEGDAGPGEDVQGDGSAGEAPGGEAGQAAAEPEPAKPAASRRGRGKAAAGNDQA